MTFVDDLSILKDEDKKAIKQRHWLNVHKKISHEKTEFICIKPNIQKLNTKYREINRVNLFQYLGEIIQPTGKEKIAQKRRAEGEESTKGNKRHIQLKLNVNTHKVRHYNTVLKP